MEHTDELENVFEIRDPEINVAEIMARIRENLAKREPLVPEVDSLTFDPGLDGCVSPEEGLKQSLQQANLTWDKIYVGDQIRPSAGLKQRVIHRVRRPLHDLVRFYVDILSAKQSSFNSAAVRSLNLLANKLERHEAARQNEIEQLRNELAEMKRSLEQLRCNSGNPGEGRDRGNADT